VGGYIEATGSQRPAAMYEITLAREKHTITLHLKSGFCSMNNGNVSAENLPVIEFEEETHDFGKITQGEKVSYSFKFKNTGKSNLLISSAQASCGCTVPKPPTEPLPAGTSNKIDVTFDSNGKSGKFDKQITVLTNCEPNTKILKITGEIIVPVTSQPNKTINNK
jgi:hypothetical protein